MPQYALVIDLNTCVGCHACATNCKEWNTQASFGPLSDFDPYGRNPKGVWYNRIMTYEMGMRKLSTSLFQKLLALKRLVKEE
jgi:Fe-S-cluster-containing dehydrogenase component